MYNAGSNPQETAEAQVDYQELRAEITRLGIKIEEAQGELVKYDGLEGKKAELEVVIAEKESVIAEKGQTIEQLTTEIERLERQKLAHAESLGSMEGEKDARLAELGMLISAQESRKNDLAGALDSMSKELVGLRSEAEQLSMAVEKLRTQRADQESEIAGLNLVLVTKQKEVAAAEKRVKDVEQEASDKAALHVAMEGDLAEYALKIKSAKNQLAQVIVEYADYEKRIKDAPSVLAELEKRIEVVEKREGLISESERLLELKKDELRRTHKNMEEYFGKPLKQFIIK